MADLIQPQGVTLDRLCWMFEEGMKAIELQRQRDAGTEANVKLGLVSLERQRAWNPDLVPHAALRTVENFVLMLPRALCGQPVRRMTESSKVAVAVSRIVGKVYQPFLDAFDAYVDALTDASDPHALREAWAQVKAERDKLA